MEGNNLIKKGVVVAVILLFISVSVVPSTGTVVEKKPTILTSFDGNILYVGGSGPGNYSRIQDAIDNATNGDTVFVYDDASPYNEHIIVNKSISLNGENKHTTVIDGMHTGHIITITSEHVTVQGFLIENGKYGIILRSNYSHIKGNIVQNNNERGIYFGGLSSNNNDISANIIRYNGIGVYDDKKQIPVGEPENNVISDNIISYNTLGIMMMWNWGNIVSKNTITHNDDWGIKIALRKENIIKDNIIDHNRKGIWISDTDKNFISGNTITNSSEGIYITSSDDNVISNNTLSYNQHGIAFGNSRYNIISNNTISNNHGTGIFLDVSGWSNEILRNMISNNNVGLCIRPGNLYNSISENRFFNDGLLIYQDSNTFYNNLINEEPLVYMEEESNKVINQNAGQVILVNCNNITIRTLTISNTYVGIQLWHTNNCDVVGNTITNNNRFGIYIRGDNNRISSNRIIHNPYGIYIVESNNNQISYNIITASDGVTAWDSGDNAWDDGVFGNFWGDYRTRYPNANRSFPFLWIWDTPYEIASDGYAYNIDRFPIVGRWIPFISWVLERFY